MAEEQDFTKLPLDQLLSHKLWKARVQGYEQLSQVVLKDGKIPPFALDVIKTCCGDSNVAAQESALQLLLSIIQVDEVHPILLKMRVHISKLIVDKCLKSPRASLRQKSADLLLALIDLDTPDAIVEVIIEGTGSKQPKVVCACLAILNDIVKFYGSQTVDCKPIFKVLPQMFAHSDALVRNEAQQLAVSIFQWIGLKPFESVLYPLLKPVQMSQLNEAFDTVKDVKLVQTRFLNKQKDRQQTVQSGDDIQIDVDQEAVGGEQQSDQLAEELDFTEPVDVLSNVPADIEDQLSQIKWKDKKEALDNLCKILDAPKYVKGNFHPLLSVLCKKVGDINIAVAVSAIQCVEKIASGLKQDFPQFKNDVKQSLLDRLKEKKQNVIQALRLTLDAVYQFCKDVDVFADIIPYLGNKVPQVRSEVLLVCVRYVQGHKLTMQRADAKQFIPPVVQCLDDATPEVRDAAAEVLGSLQSKLASGLLQPYLDGLDQIKLDKIKSFGSQAQQYQQTVVPKNAPSSTSSTSGKLSQGKENSLPQSSINRALKSKPVSLTAVSAGKFNVAKVKTSTVVTKKSKSQSQNSTSPPAKQKSRQSIGGSQAVMMSWTEEDAKEEGLKYFQSFDANLGSSNWKERLEAVSLLLEFDHAQSLKDVKAPVELLFKYLEAKAVWTDSNFQVMSKLFTLFKELAQREQAPMVDRAAASLCVPLLYDKIGDIKLQKVSVEALNSIMEQCGCGFVLSILPTSLKKQKSPKYIAELLKFASSALNDFGLTTDLDLVSLVAAMKECIGNANAQVRTAALGLARTLRIFVGPDITSMLDGLGASQMSLLQAEFDKVVDVAKPEPTKLQKSSSMNVDSASSAVDLTQLVPPKDIMALLPDTVIQDLADSNWKVRKEALDSIQDILKTCSTIVLPPADFIENVFALMKDHNKNLVIQVLDIIGKLSAAASKQIFNLVKSQFESIIANYTDKKQAVKVAVSECLVALISAFKTVQVKELFHAGLQNNSGIIRKEILDVLVDRKELCTALDASTLVSAVVSCLGDKQVDVRQSAQKFTQSVLKSIFDAKTLLNLFSKFKADKNALALLAGDSKLAKTAPASPQSARKISQPALKAKTLQSSISTKSLASVSRNISSTSISLKASSVDLAQSSGDEYPFIDLGSDSKQQRMLQERSNSQRWQSTQSQAEYIEQLQSACSQAFSEDLTKLLFDKGHSQDKSHMAAVNIIDKALSFDTESAWSAEYSIQQQQSLALNVSDLILKYVSVRLNDTNTVMTIKCLEIVQKIVDLMEQADNYRVTDYDIDCIFSALSSKLGDAKENIRQQSRTIVRKIGILYPASKCMPYLIQALESKNARQRAECLEEIRYFIQRNGVQVCNASKQFPLVAVLLSDRDSTVRSGAINFFVDMYEHYADEMFKYMGEISAREKSFIMDRLKRKDGSKQSLPVHQSPTPKSPSQRLKLQKEQPQQNSTQQQKVQQQDQSQLPMPASILRKPSVSQYVSSMEENAPTEIVQQVKQEVQVRTPVKRFSLEFSKLNLNSPSQAAINFKQADTLQQATQQDDGKLGYMMDFMLVQITSGDVLQAISALKQLEQYIHESPRTIESYMDRLTIALTLQVRLAFTSPMWQTNQDHVNLIRLCKHLINSLVQLFSNPQLAKSTTRESLQPLIQELLLHLTDPLHGVGQDVEEASSQLTRALNVLMLRILDNCDKNDVFKILFNLLENSVDAIDSGRQTGSAKFGELVMKCIWKLTKVLKDVIISGGIDVQVLLLNLHNFFTKTPPNEWKKRAIDQKLLGDMPYRTIKTIIHEIVIALGDQALAMMRGMVEINNVERSVVYGYLVQMNQYRSKE
ncbi:hypothetical protein MIR68_004410 [Amoeboaphelidium protococcarum]|nr:hypothetical protein MIR68_004410 [Amoeboaphelidium protococcarum]